MTAERSPMPLHPRYQLDKAFYDKIRASKSEFTLVSRTVIPPFQGRGVKVKGGQTFRVIQEEGPQVADVALWNANDPREYPGGPSTWSREDSYFISVFSRVWSDAPFLRPLATCIEDTMADTDMDGWHHHCVSTHCSLELYELQYGMVGLNGCYLNLLQGAEPFGLTEYDLHDHPVVFQKKRIDPITSGETYSRNDSKKGDYIEFFAEMDLIVSVSVCPNADNTKHYTIPGEDDIVLPLGLEVYETGLQPNELPTWTDWRPLWRGKWTPDMMKLQA